MRGNGIALASSAGFSGASRSGSIDFADSGWAGVPFATSGVPARSGSFRRAATRGAVTGDSDPRVGEKRSILAAPCDETQPAATTSSAASLGQM